MIKIQNKLLGQKHIITDPEEVKGGSEHQYSEQRASQETQR